MTDKLIQITNLNGIRGADLGQSTACATETEKTLLLSSWWSETLFTINVYWLKKNKKVCTEMLPPHTHTTNMTQATLGLLYLNNCLTNISFSSVSNRPCCFAPLKVSWNAIAGLYIY